MTSGGPQPPPGEPGGDHIGGTLSGGRSAVPALPEPTGPALPRRELFLSYLDYFRSRVIARVEGLSEAQRRSSSLPSGWTPLELLKHLTYVERRWLEWGFEGQPVTDPWGDQHQGRWRVGDDESTDQLVAALRGQAVVTTGVVQRHDLDDQGRPGERWDGADPPALERILFHLVQEYARHLGHLDIVVEVAQGHTGP